MQITVRFFGGLRNSTGTRQVVLTVPEGIVLDQAVDRLVEQFPALKDSRAGWHFAVNKTHAEVDTRLNEGDQVAVFPYIAGG